MKRVCIKKCYFRRRRWKPGDTMVLRPEEEEHTAFVTPKEAKEIARGKKIAPVATTVKEPKTLAELQAFEAQQKTDAEKKAAEKKEAEEGAEEEGSEISAEEGTEEPTFLT